MNRWCRIAIAQTALAWIISPAKAQASEPSVKDCLTASDESLKFNRALKLRDERVQLLICAAESCPVEIRQECLRRFDLVSQALPSIVFEVKDGTGADVSRVKVTMDGETLVERLDGSALIIDPGEHRFTFEMEGQPKLDKQFLISIGQKNRHERVSFPATASLEHPAHTTKASEPQPVTLAHSSMSGQRVGALVLGGVGIAAVGVGTAFGLTASSRKNAASKLCPEQECSTSAGAEKWESAQEAGNISTVAFIVGGAALVGAATLWLTDSSDEPQRPQVGLSLTGFRVAGSF